MNFAAAVTLSDDDIIARMMIPMCIETVRCIDEGILRDPADADMGLVMGIGFPVFRGGALRFIDQTPLSWDVGTPHYWPI